MEVQQKVERGGQRTIKLRSFQSWLWTVEASWRDWRLMENGKSELIQALCVRAGMIMEDASAEAVLWQAHEATAPQAKLLRLSAAAEAMATLIAVAQALSRLG